MRYNRIIKDNYSTWEENFGYIILHFLNEGMPLKCFSVKLKQHKWSGLKNIQVIGGVFWVTSSEYNDLLSYLKEMFDISKENFEKFSKVQSLLSEVSMTHKDLPTGMFGIVANPLVNLVSTGISISQKLELNRWLVKNGRDRTFTKLLIELLEKKGYKNDYPSFYRKAEIDRRLFAKMVTLSNSFNYHPDIKTVFKLIIGLEADLEEANKLLHAAAYSFGTDTFNLIIQYCIEKKIYDHGTIDEYLIEFNQEPLYCIK